MNWRQKGCLGALAVAVLLAALPIFWRNIVKRYYDRHIYLVDSTPQRGAAIVFGAAVYGNGRLSAVLRDRMDTAIALYDAGRVEKIIVSGDNQDQYYDEPGAMMDYAIAAGVPSERIARDKSGHRTYDTCYRARHVFGVDNAVLVTQAFHLPRALMTCRALGIDAVGVAADLRPYRGARWYEIRETAATLVALWDVARRQPPPVLEAGLPTP